MARRKTVAVFVLMLAPMLVQADPMKTSLRPQPRPTVAAGPELPEQNTSNAVPVEKARPMPRPASGAAVNPAPAATAAPQLSWPRPQPRPKGLATAAVEPQTVAVAAPTPKTKTRTKSKKGSVCGDPSIKGQVLDRITSRTKGCGVAEPVRVTSVEGVALSEAAIMDCATAKALKTWVIRGLQPAFGQTKVVKLQVAAHYVCRPRNNVRGNPISEHGKGKAIDIAAIFLEDGRVFSVARDWGKTLRRAYKAACGIFATTLGPGSDGYHEDHMHFDTARHRGGAYCR
jgi:hypothetical protein